MLATAKPQYAIREIRFMMIANPQKNPRAFTNEARNYHELRLGDSSRTLESRDGRLSARIALRFGERATCQMDRGALSNNWRVRDIQVQELLDHNELRTLKLTLVNCVDRC